MTSTSAVLEIRDRDERDPLIDLMAAVADGDRTAFARLYQLTSIRLFSSAVRIVGNRELGEDVLQDAYLQIWRKAGHYRPGRGAPLTWMTAIVRNRAIDKLRQLRKSAQHSALEDCSDHPALGDDPRELLERNHVVGKLREHIDSLPVNQLRALLCAYFYGMTHEELARHLDAPLGTVKTWVRRGLAQLRDGLGDELQTENLVSGAQFIET